MAVGTVYLVGAGPGDPKLLTVGGKEALARADVVVYDRLVHPNQLAHASDSAEIIYVGKQADRHTLTQDKINLVLSQNALDGKTVVRLKGGDPFVFGRGGEEAEHLKSLSIPFVVIPGVTSAIAAPAYAGIPVTHRDASSSFAVITGHERTEGRDSAGRTAGDAEERRQWDRIAHAADTLLFLMGVESLSEITSRLIENGRLPSTPVALVRWGTWAGRQETIVGELGTIAGEAARIGFKAPAVTVIGDVVKWRDRLRWFDNRPLSGKKILVTRARAQNSELVELLDSEGAEPVEFPTIKITPPTAGYGDLDANIDSLDSFDWLIFTSSNSVSYFFDRLFANAKDSRSLACLKIVAVGPATEQALKARGISADFIPEKFTGVEIAATFPVSPAGLRIIIPGALEPKETLAEALTASGAVVTTSVAYENVIETNAASQMSERISAGDVDLVTFSSSSTVKNFFTALNLSPGTEFPELVVACIGPSTAQTAKEYFGREPQVVADVHTMPGLVDAIRQFYSGNH